MRFLLWTHSETHWHITADERWVQTRQWLSGLLWAKLTGDSLGCLEPCSLYAAVSRVNFDLCQAPRRPPLLFSRCFCKRDQSCHSARVDESTWSAEKVGRHPRTVLELVAPKDLPAASFSLCCSHAWACRSRYSVQLFILNEVFLKGSNIWCDLGRLP